MCLSIAHIGRRYEMQPIVMAFFGAVIFAVIKIIEFAVVWYREQEEE